MRCILARLTTIVVMALVAELPLGRLTADAATRTHSEAPGTPSHVIATSTDSQAVVSWVAPRNTGRAPLSSYVVEVLPKSKRSWLFSVPPTTTRVTVNYLKDDVLYSFKVAAKNSSGRIGPFSSPSRPTTPSPMVQVLSTLTLDSAPIASPADCTLTLSSLTVSGSSRTSTLRMSLLE